MEGITIIQEHLCREVELLGLICGGILFTLLIAGALFLYGYLYNHPDSGVGERRTICICSAILVAFLVLFWVFHIRDYNTTHMEYTVTIDDNVGFHEFYEKYEILSVNGEEYRVIEK